jgi:hypothetical protein
VGTARQSEPIAARLLKVKQEKSHSLLKNRLVWALIGVAMVIIGLVWNLDKIFGPAYEPSEYYGERLSQYRSIPKGMTEQEVLRKLGTPDKTYYRDTAPKHYYEEGYGYEEREIINKVFIYRGGLVAYIYFDKNNAVEHVYVRGS